MSEIATPAFELAPPLATGSTIVPAMSPLDRAGEDRAGEDHDATRVPSQTGSLGKHSSGSTVRDDEKQASGSSDDEKAIARKEASGGAVDVKRAEDEYRQLERRLTELSRRASSAQDHEEKGDDFDLQGFLVRSAHFPAADRSALASWRARGGWLRAQARRRDLARSRRLGRRRHQAQHSSLPRRDQRIRSSAHDHGLFGTSRHH